MWLEKQSVGRHDDSYDAGSTSASVAGSKDQLALYAQPSIADTGNTDSDALYPYNACLFSVIYFCILCIINVKKTAV